jgi:hypothetical protein
MDRYETRWLSGLRQQGRTAAPMRRPRLLVSYRPASLGPAQARAPGQKQWLACSGSRADACHGEETTHTPCYHPAASSRGVSCRRSH